MITIEVNISKGKEAGKLKKAIKEFFEKTGRVVSTPILLMINECDIKFIGKPKESCAVFKVFHDDDSSSERQAQMIRNKLHADFSQRVKSQFFVVKAKYFIGSNDLIIRGGK